MKIRHVGLIMDGNGRWAQMKGLPRIEGHRNGVKRVNDMIDAALEEGLEAITFYTFSMENWQRPKREINALMGLLSGYLKSEMQRLHKMNCIFRAIGDIERLPLGVQKLLRQFEDLTVNNSGLIITSALSYGSRSEIINAVKSIVNDGVNIEAIDENLFSSYLYTAGVPDPDLIIRTSGEMRLSNFLLWQAAYSEFYFSDTYWPDFDKDKFRAALAEFRSRDRRFGGLAEKAAKTR